MSQRVLQQAALIDSQPARTFMMKRNTSSGAQQKPASSTSIQADAKIPQLYSRESLTTKLSARTLLQKSHSGGGHHTATSVEQQRSQPSPHEGRPQLTEAQATAGQDRPKAKVARASPRGMPGSASPNSLG